MNRQIISVSRWLVHYECGAAGPDEGCGYENPNNALF